MNSRRSLPDASRASDRKVAHLGTAGDCRAAGFQFRAMTTWGQNEKSQREHFSTAVPQKDVVLNAANGHFVPTPEVALLFRVVTSAAPYEMVPNLR